MPVALVLPQIDLDRPEVESKEDSDSSPGSEQAICVG